MLLPYGTGQDSLKQIRQIYARLAREGKLRVPGQVAREFASNRAEKLKTLYQQIALKQDTNLNSGSYPLLEGMSEYSEIQKREQQILKALGEYGKAVRLLLDKIAGWHWDDPVSIIYREFFKSNVIVDPNFDRDKLLEDLEYRYAHRIPPGYEDFAKDDFGIGDLLIWKTILKIGESEKKHLIFVTGEQKPDWWYKVNKKALYPRFELVDEYRRASGGKSLHLISFADLLKAYSVPGDVLAEVQKEEAAFRSSSAGYAILSNFDRSLYGGRRESNQKSLLGSRAETAVARWILSLQPEADIEYGSEDGPDLMVRVNGSLEGYEIWTLRGFAEASRRIREAIRRAASYGKVLGATINLVLVTERKSDSNALANLITRTTMKSIDIRLIIGIIDENETFKPVRIFNPGDLGTSEP